MLFLIQQSQHLLRLARPDHNFMSYYHATSPQLPNSLPSTPNHRINYNGLPHSLAGEQHYNNNDISTQRLLKRQAYNCTKDQILLDHPNSSVSLNGQQGRRQMLPSSHYHSQSRTNLPVQQNNFYSSGSDRLTMREADTTAASHNPQIDPYYHQQQLQQQQQQQQQWALSQDPSPHGANHVISSTPSLYRQNGSSVKSVVQNQHSPTMYNGDVHAVNCVHALDIVPNGSTLATPTRDIKLSRWYSSTSSGYDTSSSNITGRLSVTSVLSQDQNPVDDPEQSLQVASAHERKASAPIGISTRAKKMVNQQSKSLSSLSRDIQEYSYDDGENERGECNGPPSLQRQDTGHSTKVVVAGLEDSISGEHYKSIMGMKRKTPKQTTLEEVSGT